MAAAKPFIDSNVILYLLSTDTKKADTAEAILRSGGTISVQVLNEVANVCARKLGMTWGEIDQFLDPLRTLCTIEPLTLETHDLGREIAERYKLSTYDSMIIASAMLAGCDVLFSEDMQDQLRVDKKLQVLNPFAKH